MRLDLILYHQLDIERNMGSETNIFENDDENVAGVKKSEGKHPSFIENQEENIFKTLNFGNDFQHNNHEYFNEATIQQLKEKPKLCDKNDNIIDNSATALNPLNVQDQKSNLNEQIFQDHNSFKNPDIISACEVKPEDPYRGSVRLVRLQAASCNPTEPFNNVGCDVTLQNSSGVIVSSEDPNKRMCHEEMKAVTENQIVCSDGEYQFVRQRAVPIKQQIYISANSDENSQMPDATFHSMLQHDISSSTDTSNALYEHIVFSNSETSISDFPIPRIDRVESCTSPDITSSTWIMNSVNNNDSNGTSIRENENSVLQYHQNSQETSENSQSSANLSEIPDTQQMQRFITADNQVVYGYKDPNGEFHFFCPAMNERESHNEKERKRRSRVSDACSALRKLVPGLSDKTDKATVFEQAARYLKFYRDKFGTQFDQHHQKKNLLKMGCAASKAVPPPPSATETETVPKPVAFEIPIEEAETNNKTKKPPPQILQRLEEQNQNNLTAEELKEKQQKAEERRQNILEEKCRIARQAQKMFNKNDESVQNGDGEEKENKAS